MNDFAKARDKVQFIKQYKDKGRERARLGFIGIAWDLGKHFPLGLTRFLGT